MIKTDKVMKIPNWSKHEINRWADYIEFRCLYHEEHLISKDDVPKLHYLEQRGIIRYFVEICEPG